MEAEERMELKTIICPVDGTELSDKILDAAAYLHKISGAKLILLNVVEKWYRSEPLTTNSKEWKDIHEGWLNEGREVLSSAVERLKGMGVKNIDTDLRDGDAAYEIIAIATEKMADLILMATHRYTPVGKLFLGSVTDRVTKKAPCPILWLF